MTRTRAASLPTGVRPRMVFRINDRAGEFPSQERTITAPELIEIHSAGRRLQTELYARGAGWDSPRRTTDAGRLLTPADARRMLREVQALERRYYGAAVALADLARNAPGLEGMLALLADELMSWVEFWDAYCAQRLAGFAHDCPDPAAACAPPVRADDFEPQPPTEHVQQLTAAPCAPPAGTTAS